MKTHKVVHEGVEHTWTISRDKMTDPLNRPITQSLFLEIDYDEDTAIYTLKEDHHFYKDKFYPSLKVLYLEMADPTEYNFVNEYLLGWKQWIRMCNNKVLKVHIDEWREELDLKLAARAHQEMMLLVESENGNYSAAKWLADRGWNKRGAGRPSKLEKERVSKAGFIAEEEFTSDVVRLSNFREVK